jgi:hypothetical protein
MLCLRPCGHHIATHATLPTQEQLLPNSFNHALQIVIDMVVSMSQSTGASRNGVPFTATKAV